MYGINFKAVLVEFSQFQIIRKSSAVYWIRIFVQNDMTENVILFLKIPPCNLRHTVSV